MKRTVWGTALAFSCAITVGALAQSSPPQSDTQKSSPETVTVVGCVQKGEAASAAAGAAGATASASADSFILADARISPASSASGAAATGGTPPSAAGTSGSMARGETYRLTGSTADLRPHLGHQVEITGTVGAASAAGGGAGAAAGTGAATSGAAASAPKELKVQSVKMLAATCPAK